VLCSEGAAYCSQNSGLAVAADTYQTAAAKFSLDCSVVVVTLAVSQKKSRNLCTGGPPKLDAAAIERPVLRQANLSWAGDSVSALLVLPCAIRRRS
jgi:hypothetical protein